MFWMPTAEVFANTSQLTIDKKGRVMGSRVIRTGSSEDSTICRYFIPPVIKRIFVMWISRLISCGVNFKRDRASFRMEFYHHTLALYDTCLKTEGREQIKRSYQIAKKHIRNK